MYGNHLFLLNVYIKTFYFDGTVIKGLQLIKNMIVLVETFGFIKSNIYSIYYMPPWLITLTRNEDIFSVLSEATDTVSMNCKTGKDVFIRFKQTNGVDNNRRFSQL